MVEHFVLVVANLRETVRVIPYVKLVGKFKDQSHYNSFFFYYVA